MAAGIVVVAATGSVPLLSLVVITVVFAAIAIPLNVKPWRQQFISAPFLAQFRRMLPDISPTEQAALDAGTVGWEGELLPASRIGTCSKNSPTWS
jgi:acyl-CoA dehydrogenase